MSRERSSGIETDNLDYFPDGHDLEVGCNLEDFFFKGICCFPILVEDPPLSEWRNGRGR